MFKDSCDSLAVRSCIVFRNSVVSIPPVNEGRKIGENQEDSEKEKETRAKKEMGENKHSLLYDFTTG
jgi:hypothetical protein